MFLSCLPKVGTKALAVREQGGKTNEKEPMKVMEPASLPEFRKLAESAAEGMVSPTLSTPQPGSMTVERRRRPH